MAYIVARFSQGIFMKHLAQTGYRDYRASAPGNA
jgi:hypothetical protein